MRRSLFAVSLGAICVVCMVAARSADRPRAVGTGCDPDNAGLTLPPGFCAGVFARGIPSPRHIAVASNGDVFVISNTGGQRQAAAKGPKRGVYRLRDPKATGKADSAEFVGEGTGSGIWIANNSVYAEGGGTLIVRYPFRAGTTDFTGEVDTIVTGLPGGPDHITRDMVVRGNEMFVNVGSGSNVCETGGSKGVPITHPDPCPELPTRAGIWLFSATKKNQVFSPAERYVTGFRNGVGITLNPQDNQIYSTQHGRDDLKNALHTTDEYNAENPGEEFHKIVKGADYGWPYCYYSMEEKKKVTAPEFGGDGKQDDRCRDKPKPIYAFPGHWAPNASMFYTGTQFPAEYRNGLFVAFHGSWNRAPLPQAGYNVTFLPMKNGAATGSHRVFADGFNQSIMVPVPPSPQLHRPTGLAQSKDGSLLVSDDTGNLIYRIVYTGR